MMENLGSIAVAPLMGLPGITLSKTTVKDNFENADVQFRSLALLYERYHPDAMFTMMDLSLEAEACGIEIMKPENRGFSVRHHPVKKIDDLRNLKSPNPLHEGRMPMALKVIENMSKHFDCTNIAYVIGPFTLSCLLAGASYAIRSVLKDKDFLAHILHYSKRVIYGFAKALSEYGANIICVLEPSAGALSPEQFKANSAVYIKEIIDGLTVPVILHICGDTNVLLDEMVGTNCWGISIDSQVSVKHAVEQIPKDLYLFGNIDPVNILAYGDFNEIDTAVLELREMANKRENYVISSGCDLPMDTNIDNLDHFFKCFE